jgi:hypothetical protein
VMSFPDARVAPDGSWLTVSREHVHSQVAYRPLHALGPVKAWGVLLNGYIGEMHKCVADVLLAHTETCICEAREAAPTSIGNGEDKSSTCVALGGQGDTKRSKSPAMRPVK